MYPHDIADVSLRNDVLPNETATVQGQRRRTFGGPTRTSVDWHFGHFPDFMSSPLGLRFRPACPTAVFQPRRSLSHQPRRLQNACRILLMPRCHTNGLTLSEPQTASLAEGFRKAAL